MTMNKGMLVDWETADALLANANDGEQVKFFKAFVNECLSWGTFHAAQTQLATVNRKLDERDRRLLSMLGYGDGNK
jgi:hypothetical protein